MLGHGECFAERRERGLVDDLREQPIQLLRARAGVVAGRALVVAVIGGTVAGSGSGSGSGVGAVDVVVDLAGLRVATEWVVVSAEAERAGRLGCGCGLIVAVAVVAVVAVVVAVVVTGR